MVKTSHSKNKDINEVDNLIKNNMGLVIHLAQSFKPNSLEILDEFIQLGRIGLWKAIIKHDPKLGKLTTIAWNHIRWEILTYINKNKKYKNLECLHFYENSIYKYDKTPLWEILSDDITELEYEVIKLKYKGCTFKEIGYELGYTKNWAFKIFKNIKNKLNV